MQYNSPTENELLMHYAIFFGDKNIEEILKRGRIESAEDANELASFFWKVVDQSAIDAEKGNLILGISNPGSCCEDIMQNLRYHFIATGYLAIWEKESDKA